MARARCKMLDLNNAKKLFDSIDVVLSDCDGVLWSSDSVIPGNTFHGVRISPLYGCL